VPVICITIGEGASGGALGLAIGDKAFMFENTWYSVISPEACSLVLCGCCDYIAQSAESLKLIATDMLNHRLIDVIISEPLGGPHKNLKAMAHTLKSTIQEALKELDQLDSDTRIEQRMEKFCSMGVVTE